MCSCAASIWLNHSVHHSALVSLMDVQMVQGAGNFYFIFICALIYFDCINIHFLFCVCVCDFFVVVSALGASPVMINRLYLKSP